MGLAADAPGRFGFGEFELDTRRGELRKSGAQVKLQLQPFKLLTFLVVRAGQVATRDEIRQHLWGDETFVDYEQGLNYCIRQIRAVLGDEATQPRYIETCPRRGYRFVAPVVELPPGKAGCEERIMVAVLPLENLSADQEQEYLADGLTDEIITELSRLPFDRVGVIARTSAMQYKRTPKDIGQIGRELGVNYIVEGTVRRDGNRIRITAQLIRVRDQTHIWGHSYERQFHDVLLLQSELAAAIAAEVQVKLVPGQQPTVSSRRQINPEAYEAYLKGRYLWNRRTGEDLYRALELFARAIEKDPGYPQAFAGLADTYLVLLDYRYIRPNEALALAMGAAVNALRLDERLAEAHTALGHAKMHALEWAEAQHSFCRVIEIAPGYALAHYYYGNLLIAGRHFEDAIAEAHQALKLDPVSMAAEANFAFAFYMAGRYEEALDVCRKALEMHPNSPFALEHLGRILLEKAPAEAIAPLREAVSVSQRGARYLANLGYAYGVIGRKDLACEILAELTDMSKHRYVGSFVFALVKTGMDECNEALTWLERACEERDGQLPFLNVDPRLARLRADPRFQALLARIGLPERAVSRNSMAIESSRS